MAPTPTDSSSESEEDSSSSDRPSSSSGSVSGGSSPATTTTSVDIEDDADPCELHITDVFEGAEYSTRRTIIRPLPRSPILGCFSRPSSPLFSRPSSPASQPTSRPSSPLSNLTFNLNGLSCFGASASQAFEESVDHIQDTQPNVKVWVTQEVSEQAQETWRSAVEELMYPGRSVEATMRQRITSVTRGDD